MTRLCTRILILVLLFAGLLEAQRGGGRRPDPQEMEARQEFLAQLEKRLEALAPKLDSHQSGDFRAIARRVLRRIDGRQFEELKALSPADQTKRIIALHKEQAEEDAQRYLRKLSPELRAELEKLEPKERDARIYAIEAGKTLERAISMASGHDLVSEQEIQRLRALEPKEQISAAYRLHREIFLHVHGSELSEEDTQRLRDLDGRSFWRDPLVRRFRIDSGISGDDIKRLRRLEDDKRKLIFAALKEGTSLDTFVADGTIDAETAARWSKLDANERGRLFRVLDRLHFSGRDHFIPFDMIGKLPEEARGQFWKQPHDERLDFLRKNLSPANRARLEQRIEAMQRLKPILAELEPGQQGLLFAVMPVVARERLQSFLPERAAELDTIVADLEAAGFFELAVPLRRSWRQKLSEVELETFDGLSIVKRADFLFERFPEDYDRELREVLERGRHKLPENWAQLSGAEKFAFIHRLGVRLNGDRFGRRGRPGPEDREGREGRPDRGAPEDEDEAERPERPRRWGPGRRPEPKDGPRD